MAVPDPDPVGTELERVARRWQQLPLDRALVVVPRVRAVAQELADAHARHRGRTPQPLPDLGPAVLLDQLRVVVHDRRQDTAHGAEPDADVDDAEVLEALTALRRALP